MPLPGIPTPASGISASDQGPHDVSRFNLSTGRCALPGLVAGAHVTQRSRRRDCQAQEDRGADATDVNPLGTAAWLDLLAGDAAAAFRAAPTTQWKQDTGKKAPVLGYVQDGGLLSWVKVLNAGHLAVGDQPLLIDLIDDQLLTAGD